MTVMENDATQTREVSKYQLIRQPATFLPNII